MANATLQEASVVSIAQELLPGCKPCMWYRIAFDDFIVQIEHGEEVCSIDVKQRDLCLSSNDFAALLKRRLPTEWLEKPLVEADDFDRTG